MSLVEMLVSVVIFSILALMAVPFAETYREREKEVLLQDRLTRIRRALRDYAYTVPTEDIDGDGVDGEDPAGDADGDGFDDDDFDGNVDEDGAPNYPSKLEDLVTQGFLGDPSRPGDPRLQIPRDPTMLDPTATPSWETIEVTRQFVFFNEKGEKRTVRRKGIIDVRSKNTNLALDGTRYSDF